MKRGASRHGVAFDGLDLAALHAGAIVWVLDHDRDLTATHLVSHLEDWEISRMRQFREPHLGVRYAEGHVALRILLGIALKTAPAAVPLAVDARGKPKLCCESPLSFSLSHCDETTVIGLTTNANIGIDLERPNRVVDPSSIAIRFFHPTEGRAIAALPAPLAHTAFVRSWTIKEAVLKALGVGLNLPLSEVVIPTRPLVPVRAEKLPYGIDPRRWSIHEFALVDGRLAAAVAISASDRAVIDVRPFSPVVAAAS